LFEKVACVFKNDIIAVPLKFHLDIFLP